jgi:hypothetical protein
MNDGKNLSNRRLVWRSSYPEKNMLHLLEPTGRGPSMDYSKLLNDITEGRSGDAPSDRSEFRLWRSDLFAVLRDYDEGIIEILRAERDGDRIAWVPEEPSDARDEMMEAPVGDPKDIGGQDGVLIFRSGSER